jgi:hypothetical protein
MAHPSAWHNLSQPTINRGERDIGTSRDCGCAVERVVPNDVTY